MNRSVIGLSRRISGWAKLVTVLLARCTWMPTPTSVRKPGSRRKKALDHRSSFRYRTAR